MVEHLAVNEGVTGSSPVGGANLLAVFSNSFGFPSQISRLPQASSFSAREWSGISCAAKARDRWRWSSPS